MKKKHKRTINKRKFFLIVLIFMSILFFYKKINGTTLRNNNEFVNKFSLSNNSKEYEIIKKDSIDSYPGLGQQKVNNKKGYFSTFTTSSPNKKTYIEYKQNGNSPWSKNTYWNDYMENSGCGITSMAIILSGYGKTTTPEDLRNKYYPVMDYDSMQDEFYDEYNIETTTFYYDATHLSQDYINEHLVSNRPILICTWTNPSTNRWTTSSHYMVLLATDGDNMVYISNPNGGSNDSKSSGWYEYDEIIPYIAKALFVESYK